jgi:hypothetical protein
MVYAGYRGKLPPWAAGAVQKAGCAELCVESQFGIRFVPLSTKVHFCNYKPDFMLSVLHDHCPSADALFYFDPDIVVFCRWSFLEEWVQAGIALCADLYPDMDASHPLRHAWLQYFGQSGFQLVHELNVYYNSGFIGVVKQNTGFLNTWQRLQQLMEPALGGSQTTKVRDRTFLFHSTDQDALNAATMVCKEPISCVGLQGMDFMSGGGYIMSHAVDEVKPWRKNMLSHTLLHAQPPTRADKAYFRYVSSPIRLYSLWRLSLRKLDLWAGSALGRYLH